MATDEANTQSGAPMYMWNITLADGNHVLERAEMMTVNDGGALLFWEFVPGRGGAVVTSYASGKWDKCWRQ